MVRSSNLTRHGDEIIEQVTDATGRTKFVAKKQFQQFLDEVGTVVNVINVEGGTTTVVQQLTSEGSFIPQLLVENSKLKKDINALLQILNENDSQQSAGISQLSSLKKSNSDNKQLIAEQKAIIDTLTGQLSKMDKRINNLEQLIHGD